MAKTVEVLAEKRLGRRNVYEQRRWVIRWPSIFGQGNAKGCYQQEFVGGLLSFLKELS